MQASETSPLAARFAQLAQDCGTQPAMTFRGDERKATQTGDSTFAYDFAKFWRRVARVTAHLQSTWGVQPGDRVAWLGFNHELQLVTLVACARLGAVFLPLNFRLAVPELQQVMQDAHPRLLVHDSHHADTARALHVERLQHTHHETLIATASPRALPLPAVHGELPLLLVYTSGTTGVPKGAVHTQAALLANARASAWAHDFAPGDKVLSTLPLFHVGGLCIQTLPALLAGVEVVLHTRFDPSAWLDEMSTSQPSLSLLVPATMRAVFEHPRWADTSLAGLRGIMTGSSTVPVAYLDTLHARGVPVGQVYGTTETGPVSIVLRLPEAMARVGASGWPHPQAQVKLIDAQDREVGPGETGEVCLRADNLMSGYWSAQGQSGLGLQDGWFHSGDLGQRDADGCITIVGRSKDMVISGGENIYPAEIENQLVTLPGVAECAVVGVADARWGEVPVAVLVRTADASGQALSAETVLAHLQPRIARFKLPRRVVFVGGLPKSALGKVLKPQLQSQLTGTNP
ncbi:class I adenylate-forming enzyme family protein [Limnohabitans sp. 2KL-27]|uniref:class I adenylate-forming enzyme family protein n=1 Tax=Limnohabitans sp. 2KL-27 TaxID=1100705 RepID=UPI000AD16DD6|nr:AMP-binding protein [Limnohabitans sp. 2KL-27]